MLRVGMVGAGWWATTAHLPALAAHPRVHLVAVIDSDHDLAERAAHQYGADTSAPSLAEVVDRLDAVVIATPHTTHHALGAAALDAGLHALIEKPLTTTAADAWDLVERAQQANLVLAGGSTYQYQDTIPRIRAAVQMRIGDLVGFTGDFSSSAGRLYSAPLSPIPPNRVPGRAHPPTYSDPALSGGGQAQTQLSHILGSALYLSGYQASEVSAFMDNRELPVDVVDALVIRLENGALGTVSSVGTVPAGTPGRHHLRFYGTEGMVEYDMLDAQAWLFTEGGGAEWIRRDVTRPSYPIAAPVEAFVATVLDGAPHPSPADLSAAAVSVIDAAYESVRTGAAAPVHQGTVSTPRG